MKIVHINTTDNRGGAAQIAHLLHRGLNMIPGIQSRMLVREKNSDDPTIDRLAVTGWRRWLSIVTGHDHTFLGGMSLLDHPWVQESQEVCPESSDAPPWAATKLLKPAS